MVFLRPSLHHTSDYGRSLVGDMPGVESVKLRDCLAEAHQDIITCWNFRDEEKVRYLPVSPETV
jgi:hypothetical protein